MPLEKPMMNLPNVNDIYDGYARQFQPQYGNPNGELRRQALYIPPHHYSNFPLQLENTGHNRFGQAFSPDNVEYPPLPDRRVSFSDDSNTVRYF